MTHLKPEEGVTVEEKENLNSNHNHKRSKTQASSNELDLLVNLSKINLSELEAIVKIKKQVVEPAQLNSDMQRYSPSSEGLSEAEK